MTNETVGARECARFRARVLAREFCLRFTTDLSQRRPTHLRNNILSPAFYNVIQLMTTFVIYFKVNTTFLSCYQRSVAYYYGLTKVSGQSFLAVSYD